MERQACAAFLHRYWQKPALVRLCRCERRLACSITEEDDVPSKSIPLNNRAHFKVINIIDSKLNIHDKCKNA